MKVKRNTQIEMLIVVFIFVIPASGLFLSEIRWARVNRPDGKFSNVNEYIAHGRRPSRVTKVEKGGKAFFIAYGPMDMWLALPSGPAAYVFDETGHMVEWSWDTGDDPGFQREWTLSQGRSSLEELKSIGFQQTLSDDGQAANPRPE